MSSAQRKLLVEALRARERAEAAVQELLAARENCERHRRDAGQPDLYKNVTGKSGIEKALERARRLVQMWDATINDLRARMGRDAEAFERAYAR